jgi:hypothetical protein
MSRLEKKRAQDAYAAWCINQCEPCDAAQARYVAVRAAIDSMKRINPEEEVV